MHARPPRLAWRTAMAFLAAAILTSWGAAAARGPLQYSGQIGMTNFEFVASSRHIAVATHPSENETAESPRPILVARQYTGNSCTLCVRPEEIQRLIVKLVRQRRLTTPAAILNPGFFCDQNGRLANISTAWVGTGALTLCLPFVMGLKRRAELHRRRREKRCVNCGYELQGNESGICPECGVPIPH